MWRKLLDVVFACKWAVDAVYDKCDYEPEKHEIPFFVHRRQHREHCKNCARGCEKMDGEGFNFLHHGIVLTILARIANPKRLLGVLFYRLPSSGSDLGQYRLECLKWMSGQVVLGLREDLRQPLVSVWRMSGAWHVVLQSQASQAAYAQVP